MRLRRAAVVTTCLSISLASLSAVAAASPRTANPAGSPGTTGTSSSWADFNGDGFDDLAIGVPFESVGSVAKAGAVQVLYGSTNGLQASDDDLWTQNSTGFPDVAESGDLFGWAVAPGDYNEDGFGDLAVGAPGEDRSTFADSGAVFVILGSSSGLTTNGVVTRYGRDHGANQAGSEYGFALAAIDLPSGGPTELLISYPGMYSDRGAVQLATHESAILNSQYVLGGAGSGADQAGARCGEALTAGEFSDDIGGATDIAIGCPLYDIEGPTTKVDAGRVRVIYGEDETEDILVGAIDDAGFVEAGDRFGQSLAAGDFVPSGVDELIVGVPYEDLGSISDAGVVHVYRGQAGGLTDPSTFSAANDGAAGEPAAGDRFGAAILVSDVGRLNETVTLLGDVSSQGFITVRRADLVIGIPGRDVAGRNNAGAFVVIYQQSNGGPISSELWTQDAAGVMDVAEKGDRFGESLAAGQFRGTTIVAEDLAVGVPFEDVGSIANAGAVHTFRGGSDRLTTIDQVWHQAVSGVRETPETGDRFGQSLGRRSADD